MLARMVTEPTALSRFWPLTRAMALVEARPDDVAAACHKYLRTKRIHPRDKVSRYDVTELDVVGLAATLAHLLPVALTATKTVVLPAGDWSAILHNDASGDPNLGAYVSRALAARVYSIQCDGTLPSKTPKTREASFAAYLKGPRPRRMLAAKNGKVTIAVGKPEPFETEAAPKRLDDLGLLEMLAGAGLCVHDPAFFTISKTSRAWVVAWTPAPAIAPVTMDLATARTKWLRAGRLA